jgi:putative Mg2+ transporter-C (MgtC) family protein
MFHFPLEIYLRLIVSLFVGLLLGYERERRHKPAGLKTISLVCLSSTLIMILSIKGGTHNDPMRLAAQVVNGIGFIGAGVIWKSNSGLRGITTAADIWVASAIGLTIGLGYYDLTIVALACVLFILNFANITGIKSHDDVIEIQETNNDSDKKNSHT